MFWCLTCCRCNTVKKNPRRTRGCLPLGRIFESQTMWWGHLSGGAADTSMKDSLSVNGGHLKYEWHWLSLFITGSAHGSMLQWGLLEYRSWSIFYGEIFGKLVNRAPRAAGWLWRGWIGWSPKSWRPWWPRLLVRILHLGLGIDSCVYFPTICVGNSVCFWTVWKSLRFLCKRHMPWWLLEAFMFSWGNRNALFRPRLSVPQRTWFFEPL